MDWQTIDTAPKNEVVMTKIDDSHGVRNEQTLKLHDSLWFYPDDSVYVYYRPTHWRPLTDKERSKEEADLIEKVEQAQDKLEQFRGRSKG